MAKVIFDFDPAAAGQLHCDACGYDAPEKIALTRDLIGTRCPKCGADMLTASDFDKTEAMVKGMLAMNCLFGEVMGREPDGKTGQLVQINIHDDEIVVKTGGEHADD